MSPASKSKKSTRAAKEHPKASSKSIIPGAGGNGIAANAYDPVSGTFHALETAPPSSSHLAQNNGRFRKIDETDDHSGSSLGTTAEYDSVSNNGSCSGESEDPKDERAAASTARTEPIPGSDTDKRDKIRQKNEKKHKRQKEKRAQELHERCSGYLMSRKLEVLAQQLLAMGFTSERATMALILNEGRVEESIAWLLEGSDEGKQQTAPPTVDGAVNLKIDIAEELARIADMEVKFKCTTQEVEKVVVSCEGDLDKAAEILKDQKNELAAVKPKLEEPDPAPSANGFSKVGASIQNSMVRTQAKGVMPASVQQQRRDERDFNYAKVMASASVPLESAKNMQSVRRIQSKPDWARTQVTPSVDKRWSGTSSSPSVSYPLASPSQVAAPLTKPEARYITSGNEAKANLQTGMLREQITVMLRPQSMNARQNLPSISTGMNGSSPPTSAGWYPNGVSSIEMLKAMNGGLGYNLHGGLAHSTQNLGMSGSGPQQFYPQQNHYRPFLSTSMDSGASNGFGSSRGSGALLAGSTLVTSGVASTQIAEPSSLGLYTGWDSGGSSGASSRVDWSTGGSMLHCDYNRVDWSLDSSSLPPSSLKGDGLYDTWSRFAGVNAAMPVVNGGGVYVAGLQDGNLVNDTASSAVSHEWTSPFTGKDLFRVPRKFVTSPSL